MVIVVPSLPPVLEHRERMHPVVIASKGKAVGTLLIDEGSTLLHDSFDQILRAFGLATHNLPFVFEPVLELLDSNIKARGPDDYLVPVLDLDSVPCKPEVTKPMSVTRNDAAMEEAVLARRRGQRRMLEARLEKEEDPSERASIESSLAHLCASLEKPRVFDPQAMIPEFFAKSITGQTHTFTNALAQGSTVFALKKVIQETVGIPLEQQRIVFNGKQLEDEKCMYDYGIEAGSVIHLLLSLRGGMYHFSSGRSDLAPVGGDGDDADEPLEPMVVKHETAIEDVDDAVEAAMEELIKHRFSRL